MLPVMFKSCQYSLVNIFACVDSDPAHLANLDFLYSLFFIGLDLVLLVVLRGLHSLGSVPNGRGFSGVVDIGARLILDHYCRI